MPDESEPGTIKDRFIMTHLPHLSFEGMLIAASSRRKARHSLHPRISPSGRNPWRRDQLLPCIGLLEKKSWQRA